MPSPRARRLTDEVPARQLSPKHASENGAYTPQVMLLTCLSNSANLRQPANWKGHRGNLAPRPEALTRQDIDSQTAGPGPKLRSVIRRGQGRR